MELSGAIVFITREPGSGRTLMLEPLLFSPAAVWMVHSLKAIGVDRFFVVCHPDDRAAAQACFPDDAQFVTAGTDGAAEQLNAFLDAHAGMVLVATRPILLSDAGARITTDELAPIGLGSGLFRIDGALLRAGLDGEAELETVLKQKGHEFGARRPIFALSTDLEQAEQAQLMARYASVERLTRSGVRMIDPAATYVDPTVTVGAGTVLLPGTILRGTTAIGQNCEVGPNTQIRDCIVGDGTTITYSQLTESNIGSRCTVGPFAYLRPHCTVGDGVKVGDFVELKNSTIGNGTKISHLTYVGDADVGSGVNFGCGTVTVNYDGASKFRTLIGDNAFIGCNTNLVAPVQVGAGSYIAAGSTVTDSVPADSLAIARAKQTVKVGWAKRRRAKKIQQK